MVRLHLAYRPPFNWSLLTAFLAAEATPGVEAVRDGDYRRTIAIGKAAGWLSVRLVPRRNLLRLSLQLPDYARLKPIIERVRAMFDLGANPVQIERHRGRHPRLAPLMRRAQGLRLAGAWDGFEVLAPEHLPSPSGRRGCPGRQPEPAGDPACSPCYAI